MLPAILRRFARVPFKIHGVTLSRRFGNSSAKRPSESAPSRLNMISSVSANVVDIVAVKAPEFIKFSQASTDEPQRIQQESVKKKRNQHGLKSDSEKAGESGSKDPRYHFRSVHGYYSHEEGEPECAA